MPCCQKDLSLPTYGLIAFFFVGQEVLGLKTTLVFGLALVGATLVLSIAAMLFASWRKLRKNRRMPPKRVGIDR
jgi:uncharacterized membrane protein (GlpM family)